MFIYIVHAFPIDLIQIFQKKNMLLYEVILGAECFYFIFSFL